LSSKWDRPDDGATDLQDVPVGSLSPRYDLVTSTTQHASQRRDRTIADGISRLITRQHGDDGPAPSIG
jgi:hypothetical protein